MSIYKSAIAYSELFKKEYNFILGKKGKKEKIVLKFSFLELPHLMGLHYLKDIAASAEKPSIVFNRIKQKKYTDTLFENSLFYEDINERIGIVADLENILDSENVIFKLIKNKFYSKINANYILECVKENKIVYIFITLRDGFYYPISLFYKKEKDYTQNQPKCTVLKKDKICDGKTETLYIRDGYIPQ